MKKISFMLSILCLSSLLNATEIIVSVGAGKNWKEKRNPQFAIWLEDENENYIKTLYVTNCASKKSWIFSPKDGRPESLPVWYHCSNIESKKINSENKNKMELDAVTSATPKGGIIFQSSIGEKPYIIKAEFNNSFDYNDFYTKESTGVNGQPSVIYKAFLPKEINNEITLSFVGTGATDGKNGNISTDTIHLSTAKNIVKCITIKLYNSK